MSIDSRALPIPLLWHKPLDEFLDHCAAFGLAADTISSYEERLLHFARATKLAPYEVTHEQLVDFLSVQEWAHETRRARIQSYRKFWEWALLKGRISEDPTVGLPYLKPAEPAPRPLPYRIYIECLFRAPERTRLILRLAGELGLRRGEIAIARSEDLTKHEQGWSLFVHGKGGKNRTVPVTDSLAHTILARGEGWLFPGETNGHLSRRHVAVLAQRYLPGDWTLHTLRHMFGTRSYEASRDLLAVQKLLGHASPTTTINYVAVSDHQLRAVVEAVTSTGAGRPGQNVVTIDMDQLSPAHQEVVRMILRSNHTPGPETALAS